jgi:hypothetical protein
VHESTLILQWCKRLRDVYNPSAMYYPSAKQTSNTAASKHEPSIASHRTLPATKPCIIPEDKPSQPVAVRSSRPKKREAGIARLGSCPHTYAKLQSASTSHWSAPHLLSISFRVWDVKPASGHMEGPLLSTTGQESTTRWSGLTRPCRSRRR